MCGYRPALFQDPWSSPESGRVHISAHVWSMKIDVMQKLVARYRRRLETHFRPFSKSAAILHLQPAADLNSTIVTVYVADERSVKYLQEQAEILQGFHYFKVVSCSEVQQVEELPLLRGVKEGYLNTDMVLRGGPSLAEASIMPLAPSRSKAQTSLLLDVFNEDSWHLR